MGHFTADSLNRTAPPHVGADDGTPPAGTPNRRRAMSLPGAEDRGGNYRSATVTSGLATPLTSTDCTWIFWMSSRAADVDATSSNGSWLVFVP